MSSVENKVVVLTGGTGYVGSVLVRVLSAAGYTPVVLTRRAQEDTKGVHYLLADLTKAETVLEAAREVESAYGSVAALVHAAAAPLARKPLLSLTSEEFVAGCRSQTIDAFQFFKAYTPLVREGGHLIGITTTAIDSGAVYSASGVYVPAKAALRAMLRVLAHELKDRSIAVSALAPAFMPGGLNGDMPASVIALLQQKSKPEDVTSPEEVAEVLLAIVRGEFLAAGKSVRVPGRELSDL